jgi:hypothetical protein
MIDNAERPVLPAGRIEIVDPYVFLDELFDFARLPELQLMLREWFETTITDSWQHKTSQEREDIVLLFRKLEGLLAVSNTIHQERQEAGRLYQ